MFKTLLAISIIFNSQISLFTFKEHNNIISKNNIFVDDKIQLESIFKQKIKIVKILDSGSSKEKPILFEVEGRKFVFKLISENRKDAEYFIEINDFMSQNLIPIHKLFLVNNFYNGTYGVFEYFENFVFAPFRNYHKIGRILAIIDDTMKYFEYNLSNVPKFETKIEMFNNTLKQTKNKGLYYDYLNISFNCLNFFQKHFYKTHGHFDLNCGNLDTRYRIIDVGYAHYDWRINNFLNILFVNKFKSNISGEDALLQAIIGYNSATRIKLNAYELIGILDIVVGYISRAKLLNKPDNLLQTNIDTLLYFKAAI